MNIVKKYHSKLYVDGISDFIFKLDDSQRKDIAYLILKKVKLISLCTIFSLYIRC